MFSGGMPNSSSILNTAAFIMGRSAEIIFNVFRCGMIFQVIIEKHLVNKSLIALSSCLREAVLIKRYCIENLETLFQFP